MVECAVVPFRVQSCCFHSMCSCCFHYWTSVASPWTPQSWSILSSTVTSSGAYQGSCVMTWIVLPLEWRYACMYLLWPLCVLVQNCSVLDKYSEGMWHPIFNSRAEETISSNLWLSMHPQTWGDWCLSLCSYWLVTSTVTQKLSGCW